MKNILGKDEDLELYNKQGKIVYGYYIYVDGDSAEYTFDSFGNVLTYKNSKGYSEKLTRDFRGKELTFENSDDYSYKYTRDSLGNILTFEDSGGLSYKYTRDSLGNEQTYENSNGVRRGFDVPEYTAEHLLEILKEKIGEFKVVVK